MGNESSNERSHKESPSLPLNNLFKYDDFITQPDSVKHIKYKNDHFNIFHYQEEPERSIKDMIISKAQCKRNTQNDFPIDKLKSRFFISEDQLKKDMFIVNKAIDFCDNMLTMLNAYTISIPINSRSGIITNLSNSISRNIEDENERLRNSNNKTMATSTQIVDNDKRGQENEMNIQKNMILYIDKKLDNNHANIDPFKSVDLVKQMGGMHIKEKSSKTDDEGNLNTLNIDPEYIKNSILIELYNKDTKIGIANNSNPNVQLPKNQDNITYNNTKNQETELTKKIQDHPFEPYSDEVCDRKYENDLAEISNSIEKTRRKSIKERSVESMKDRVSVEYRTYMPKIEGIHEIGSGNLTRRHHHNDNNGPSLPVYREIRDELKNLRQIESLTNQHNIQYEILTPQNQPNHVNIGEYPLQSYGYLTGKKNEHKANEKSRDGYHEYNMEYDNGYDIDREVLREQGNYHYYSPNGIIYSNSKSNLHTGNLKNPTDIQAINNQINNIKGIGNNSRINPAYSPQNIPRSNKKTNLTIEIPDEFNKIPRKHFEYNNTNSSPSILKTMPNSDYTKIRGQMNFEHKSPSTASKVLSPQVKNPMKRDKITPKTHTNYQREVMNSGRPIFELNKYGKAQNIAPKEKGSPVVRLDIGHGYREIQAVKRILKSHLEGKPQSNTDISFRNRGKSNKTKQNDLDMKNKTPGKSRPAENYNVDPIYAKLDLGLISRDPPSENKPREIEKAKIMIDNGKQENANKVDNGQKLLKHYIDQFGLTHNEDVNLYNMNRIQASNSSKSIQNVQKANRVNKGNEQGNIKAEPRAQKQSSTKSLRQPFDERISSELISNDVSKSKYYNEEPKYDKYIRSKQKPDISYNPESSSNIRLSPIRVNLDLNFQDNDNRHGEDNHEQEDLDNYNRRLNHDEDDKDIPVRYTNSFILEDNNMSSQNGLRQSISISKNEE